MKTKRNLGNHIGIDVNQFREILARTKSGTIDELLGITIKAGLFTDEFRDTS